jgi:hypothetical protein
LKSFLESLDLFDKALSKLCNDEAFCVSERAERASLCAQRLMRLQDRSVVAVFSRDLLASLRSCFHHPQKKLKCRYFRERIWESYYKLCASDEFRGKWKDFLGKTIGFSACPIFYEYITNELMDKILFNHFKVSSQTELADDQLSSTSHLDYEDMNSLYFTAGYVIRSLTKKISKSKHNLKGEILVCLQEMAQGEHDEDDLEMQEWIKLVDRGGLIHVSEVTYMVFHVMECTFRQYFKPGINSNLKDMTEKILTNEELLFYWALVSVNWSDEESSTLQKLMVEHWITLRGFSSASAINELYKQEHNKTVQKSKPLRKVV